MAVYLVVSNPALTGIDAHEWLGLGVLLVFLVHCVAHADWVGSALFGFGRAAWSVRGNLALDVLILAAFAVVMVSGLGVSGAVLPSMGLYVEGYFFWDPLHSIAAKVLLALLLLHVVVHGKWIIGLIKKGKDTRDE
nr:DUF4405 domain-containing protein [Gordonibacter massiliensis (ex Traore et al. 2017)]